MTYFIVLTILLIGVFVVMVIMFKSFNLSGKLKKAEQYLTEGKINESSEIVREILGRQKDNVQARYLRAEILMQEKQYLMAIAEFNGLLNIPDMKLYISEIDVHNNLAEMYNATNNFKKELEEYRFILTLKPEDIKANFRLGLALYNQKNYKDAKGPLSRVIQLDPQYTDVFMPLGITLYHLGEFDNAESWLSKALTSAQNNHEAMFYLGLIFKQKKIYDSAISMFNQAKTSSDFSLSSIMQISEIYSEQKQYDRVIETLEQAQNNINDARADAWALRYLLAECYEQKGMIREAVKQWEMILKHTTDYRDTKSSLDNYKKIMRSNQLVDMFSLTIEKLQPYISDIILGFNFNIISQEQLSTNEYKYKAYNIKRTNDPPTVIIFDRTTKEINENNLSQLESFMSKEKCKNGMYLTTGSFSMKAKAVAPQKQIELYDGEYLSKAIERINIRSTLNIKKTNA